MPAAPPNCSASVSLRKRCSRSFERCSAAAYSASFSPNGIGSACCSQVRATTGGMAVLTRQPGKARDGAVDVGEQRIDAGAKAEHGAGIDDVLAGRAPMHVARGLGVHFGDVGRQRLDEGDGEVAGPGRGLRQRGEVE